MAASSSFPILDAVAPYFPNAASTSPFNDSELIFLTRMPAWALALAVVMLGFSLWLSSRSTRGAPASTRLLLLGLRATLLTTVFFLLLEPGQRLLATSREANRVVIAVDTSSSMAETDGQGAGQNRLRRAIAAGEALMADLAQRSEPYVVEWLAFDREARPTTVEQLRTLAEQPTEPAPNTNPNANPNANPNSSTGNAGERNTGESPWGGASMLRAPLSSIATGNGEKPLGGVVVMSDGADTSNLKPTSSPELRALVEPLKAPIHTVAIGDSTTFKDIALTRVEADDFAFVRNQVTAQVVIRQQGFAGSNISLTLKEDGRPLKVVSVTLTEKGGTVTPIEQGEKKTGATSGTGTGKVPNNKSSKNPKNGDDNFDNFAIRDDWDDTEPTPVKDDNQNANQNANQNPNQKNSGDGDKDGKSAKLAEKSSTEIKSVEPHDPAETIVSITFEPSSAGKHLYTIATPVLAGEAVAENNRIDFALKVIRDRIRVLQVVGKPSWDERFVRRLLKENPSVDLISFFILRSTTDLTGASSNDLSLIPFPTRELFIEELKTFDVVIFQDFNFRPYQMGMYLDEVQRFVTESGGGFLMLGGSLSFSEGEYSNTPIADILPVRLLPGTGHISEEKYRPLVTAAGKTHPITDLGDVVGSNEGFDKLPELEGTNLVAGLMPGAEVLLSHPFLNAQDGPQPVVAVREVGQGRSMAVLTDSTWLWALPHAGVGGRGDAHRKFYANALRWLIRDPELSRVKVQVEERTAEPNKPIHVVVRSYNARYAPEGGSAARVTFTPLDTASGANTVGKAAATAFDGQTAEDGSWALTFTPPSAGAWRVHVDATRDGKSIGSDEDAFVVQSTQLEKRFREPRPDVLAALASTGQGKMVTPEDVTSLEFIDHKVERVHRQKTEPLWNTWWAILLVVSLASSEWWLRRRQGFT